MCTFVFLASDYLLAAPFCANRKSRRVAVVILLNLLKNEILNQERLFNISGFFFPFISLLLFKNSFDNLAVHLFIFGIVFLEQKPIFFASGLAAKTVVHSMADICCLGQ